VQVADQNQYRAVGPQPVGVQRAQLARPHAADLVRLGGLHGVRMAAVHPLQQRGPGQVPGLAQRDLDVVDEPIPFGGDLLGRVRGVGEHGGQDLEHPIKAAGERVAGDEEPVRVQAGG
jgi:hypothetical protein